MQQKALAFHLGILWLVCNFMLPYVTFQKPTLFKGKYEAKLKFPEGWGFQTKISSVVHGGMEIFWNNILW